MRAQSDPRAKMPFSDLWAQMLGRERGAAAAAELMAAIRSEYERLRAEGGPVEHRGLRRHLWGNILPQLAAYRTLRRAEGAEAALAAAQGLHFGTLAGLKRGHARAASLPIVFGLYRLLVPAVLRFGHPKAGWDIEWIENSSEQIYAKVHRCFYHEWLKDHGAGEMIFIYCRGDDHVFAEVHSRHIEWTREKTRPRGDAYCDVRYDRRPNGRTAK